MRTVIVALLLGACGVDMSSAGLAVEPASIDTTVFLDSPTTVALHVTRDDSDVTATATFALTGSLGSIDATGTFANDGRTAGRATILVAVDGETVTVPVRVAIRSKRFVDAPEAVATWFAAAHDVEFDASLEPGDGAVIPPNLGHLEASFTAAAGDESPAGNQVAYVSGPQDPNSGQLLAHDVYAQPIDTAAATLGTARVLYNAGADFVKLPDFSPDDRWITVSRVPKNVGVPGTIVMMPVDGSSAPIDLANGYDMSRFASPIAAVRAGGTDTEPMTWMIMRSDRTGVRQLWAMAVFPERGVASRPILLPGQRRDVAILHAPTVLPSM